MKTETVVSGDISEITRYVYDDNGNQTLKATETIKPQEVGTTESFSVSVSGESGDGTVSFNEYDGFNQLVKVTSGDMTATYEYNGDGLRDNKTINGATITQIWDGTRIALELNDQGAVINRYLSGINFISAEDGTGTGRYYLYNGHGDVVQLTSSSGTVTKTYDYDAFGVEKNPDPEDTNVFRYCGQYLDIETGTYYLQSRYYDPIIGRFISADSNLGEDNDPLSLNLYTYCLNNPIMYVDEDGHIAVLTALAIGAFAGTLIGGGVSAFLQYHMNNGNIDWGDVWIAAGAGALSGGLTGSGAGISLVMAGNAAISAGQYSLTQWSNNEAITRFGIGSSFFVGGLAGAIGGKGAYPEVAKALRPLSSVVPNIRRGAISGFSNRSTDVIKHLYQPEVTSSLLRLARTNIIKTAGATMISNAPSIMENLGYYNYSNYNYFNNYYNYYDYNNYSYTGYSY